jgi:hypothetical protein
MKLAKYRDEQRIFVLAVMNLHILLSEISRVSHIQYFCNR